MAAMVDRIFFILVLFDVIHKGIRVGVTLVCIVALTTHFLPVVVGREEGVGFRRGVVDLRQTETVGQWQSLLIDTGTTYYIYILIGSAMCQGFL
jgi:hypothetical protein